MTVAVNFQNRIDKAAEGTVAWPLSAKRKNTRNHSNAQEDKMREADISIVGRHKSVK